MKPMIRMTFAAAPSMPSKMRIRRAARNTTSTFITCDQSTMSLGSVKLATIQSNGTLESISTAIQVVAYRCNTLQGSETVYPVVRVVSSLPSQTDR